MQAEQLKEILEKHKDWLQGKPEGERADLRWADLRWADLGGADLEGANLERADLRWADLEEASLRRSNLDYSVWPLWCGSLKVIVDRKIACQLAYHFCSLRCDDVEFIKTRNQILPFANQFHRVEECGVLTPISLPKKAKDREEDSPINENQKRALIHNVVEGANHLTGQEVQGIYEILAQAAQRAERKKDKQEDVEGRK